MINLDRFGGVTEPEDGVYFLTREQEAEAKEADRLAEIEDLQSEIEDMEAELKDLRAQLAELMTCRFCTSKLRQSKNNEA